MNRRNFSKILTGAAVTSAASGTLAAKAKKPNLLIIHTDEHNFRTLGCYRELLSEDQAYVWGKGVKVDTPHIDRLAHEGAICTSYFAASPVCTPSRAAMVTGLYPHHTGSPKNDLPLHDGLKTFASVLENQGYATSYVGKWHLDGDAKPGWQPARKFGFADNRYMMNRGHWKGMTHIDGKPAVIGLVPEKQTAKFSSSQQGTPENFTTDFLTDRTLEILERDKNKPFCHMVSIPDPHGPNSVRPPYDTMFDGMHFEHPRTMEVPLETMPGWAQGGKEVVTKLDQKKMQIYFGMVKCIDDNVGRIFQWLEANKLADNTIIVFTSDHGDLMGEHKKHNKGQPYETSAKIPFVIRWPKGIPAGKVINTAYTNVDFGNTMLGLMGSPLIPGSHGLNDAQAFLSSAQKVDSGRMTYITSSGGNWLALVDGRYKLVICATDIPWLFDLKSDPDELVNAFTNPEYAPVAERMMKELKRQIQQYKDPGVESKNYRYTAGPEDEPSVASGKLLTDADGNISGGQFEIKALGAKDNSWNRALEVKKGSFKPDSTYQLTINWTSKGLGARSEFYANFTGDKKAGEKQMTTWKAADGESGTETVELKTNANKKWQLIVGVRGPGHLIVDRIKITRQ
ncbi:sulfatase-like hydrolase/transferase [Pontiellaceae bacterium B12227]|nr:sulfatase-like hydrolase/transferase [Pontiellaceae bacterium B12227]